ncbi:MAG: hypothetical protein ABJ275_05200 [Maricaulaceae bacterium]
MKKHIFTLTAIAAIGLSACSHTEKVATVKPTDSKMTCEEINQEFSDLETVSAQAKKNKGASGTNIAAAVFFWPAAVGNYLDAENAEELVQERQENLVALSTKKGC